MKRLSFLLVAVATLASVIAYMVPAFGQADEKSAPVYLKPAHKCVEGSRALKHPAQCGVDANQSRLPRRTAQDN